MTKTVLRVIKRQVICWNSYIIPSRKHLNVSVLTEGLVGNLTCYNHTIPSIFLHCPRNRPKSIHIPESSYEQDIGLENSSHYSSPKVSQPFKKYPWGLTDIRHNWKEYTTCVQTGLDFLWGLNNWPNCQDSIKIGPWALIPSP